MDLILLLKFPTLRKINSKSRFIPDLYLLDFLNQLFVYDLSMNYLSILLANMYVDGLDAP